MKSKCSLAVILALGTTSLTAAQNIASPGCAKGGMNCTVPDDSSSMFEIAWKAIKQVDAAISMASRDPNFGNPDCYRNGNCSVTSAPTPPASQGHSVAVPTSNTKPETYRGQVDHFPVPVGLQGTRQVIVWGIVCPERNSSQEIVAISYNEDCNGDVCRPSVTNWPSMTAAKLRAKGIVVKGDSVNIQVEKDGQAVKEPFKVLHEIFSRP